MRNPGRIVIPKNKSVSRCELKVAKILTGSGFDVIFVPESNVPTPDIIYRGEYWEIKSPVGKSSRTIENNIRSAIRQSSNIVIDLSNIRISEERCLRSAIREIDKRRSMIHKLLIIRKDGSIYTLK